MRDIAIVGAGQSGLQLALQLQSEGHRVTVVAERTPEQVRAGRVLSTQAMFGPARALERAAGLAFWDGQAPDTGALHVTVGVDAKPVLAFDAVPSAPAQSVDQRVKTAAWLELFEERGGRVEYRRAEPEDVARLTERNALTVVAAGRGALASAFERDAARSRFDAPQRHLAAVYLHGVGPTETAAETGGSYGGETGRETGGAGRATDPARIHIVAGAGELVLQPGLTLDGPCMILLWEAIPGGPLDVFGDDPDPAEFLARTRKLMYRHVPWEYAALAEAEPTDPGATLVGAVTPTVRHPIARLGAHVSSDAKAAGSAARGLALGLADTLVVNDPITAQGANNAARCAARYAAAIGARGELPFDEAWMRELAAATWEELRHTVDFATVMLGPLPDHIGFAFAEAAARPDVAARLADTYADPTDFANWLATPEATTAYLTAPRS